MERRDLDRARPRAAHPERRIAHLGTDVTTRGAPDGSGRCAAADHAGATGTPRTISGVGAADTSHRVRARASSHVSPLLRWSTPALICVYGGAVLVALGSFLPWVKAEAGVFSATKSGIEGDGVFTLLLAVVIVVCFTLIKSQRAAGIAVLSLGAATAVVAGYELFDIKSKADAISTGLAVSASPGFGLIITGLAACAVTVGAALALGEVETG